MGAPPDYFSSQGQAWGFPVQDPSKLFNPDGSLGEGGRLLKRLFEKMFDENPGGVRIDHIIGLIDPWVYPSGESGTANGTRLYSSPEHPELGRFAHIATGDLESGTGRDSNNRVRWNALSDAVIDRYARILDKIVIPAGKAHGVPLDSIICEDLGTLTNPVVAVMEKRGLSGIRVTQFVNPKDPSHLYRGKNVASRHWITPGTHDNIPILAWAKQLINSASPDKWAHAHYLTEDLLRDPGRANAFRWDLANNPLALVSAKFAELFASPARQAQVFFADLFGLEDVYNRPGTAGEENWSLRIPKAFRKAYFDAVKDGRALNLPEALAQAMEAKGVQNPQLAKDLARYADVLKE
jgi:4-alpha-glucanotransferase